MRYHPELFPFWRKHCHWVTADHRIMLFANIPDDHLKNIIRWCKKYSDWYVDTIPYLELEALYRDFKEPIDGEPVPFRDKDGKLKTCDLRTGGYVEVMTEADSQS